jgi:hypothetical protein
MHQRQLIREAAKAALVGKTGAGARVYETRVVPFKRLELPAIAVYTLEENVDPASRSTAPRELKRTVDLAIEAAVKQGENIDDALDAIALEIERALHADETLGGAASDSILSSTEIDVLEDGDRLVGVVTLVYSVTYYTDAPAAEDAAAGELVDLARVDVRHNLGGSVDVNDEARDRLEGLDR